MNPKRIVIVGLGLMGGSLAVACRKKFPKSRIVAVTRSAESIRYAKRKRWIHEGTTNLEVGVKEADLIVLCTPVDTLEQMIARVDRFAKKGALVTDVGSTKISVCTWSEKQKFKNIHFVGAHPMVGSHLRGVEAVNPELYDHGHTILVKSKKESAKINKFAASFWKKISPKLYTLTAKEHDRVVAHVSHLPHLAAVALVLGVDPKTIPFSSTGFRDTTRIASGHPSIWAPILKSNKNEVLNAITVYEKSLKKIKAAIKQKSDKELRKMLTFAARKGT